MNCVLNEYCRNYTKEPNGVIYNIWNSDASLCPFYSSWQWLSDVAFCAKGVKNIPEHGEMNQMTLPSTRIGGQHYLLVTVAPHNSEYLRVETLLFFKILILRAGNEPRTPAWQSLRLICSTRYFDGIQIVKHIVASELKDPIWHSSEWQIGSFSSEATIYLYFN